ncbi:hypothetical protein GT022_11375 [Agaribacter marinus]|uniref:Uncharacterized protein n=1 Tax=Virgibacillus salarius TaxID=447199 RepID=A0A941E0D5_9BACI|nr:hypothetical protein [Virgibacillus salarius]MBR7796643.1 hypothetical protein [Virgibacillus salarius]NAZ09352.1 hypothetical protein [Agaribacter marinus]
MGSRKRYKSGRKSILIALLCSFIVAVSLFLISTLTESDGTEKPVPTEDTVKEVKIEQKTNPATVEVRD